MIWRRSKNTPLAIVATAFATTGRCLVGANYVINVDDTQVYQEFYGCGGSWTDSSAWIMNGSRNNPSSDPRTLSQQEKDAIYSDLFSTNGDGIGLRILRQPMGTSDFRWSDYTYEDTKGSFTISRDEAYIIPTIQRSIVENPDIKVMALPWSAPAWAKQNNNLLGGYMKHSQDPVINDYAQYFVNFVNAYEGKSIPIWALSVQNEPDHEVNTYPTMKMSSYDHGQLIKKVRAALDGAGKGSIKVVGYDHNWETPWYVTNFMNDYSVRTATDAIAFHCYGQTAPQNQDQIYNSYQVEIFFTECTESGAVNSFNQDFRWALGNLVIGATRHWASTVLEWNLVLMAGGGPKINGGCDNCRGLIDIETNGYVKRPAFYALGHLSKFAALGAKRIASTEPSDTKTLAMTNPDGSSFVIILFNGWPDRTYDLSWKGATCTVTVPSWSAVTLYRPANSLTVEVWRTNDQDSNTSLKQTETLACVGPPTSGPPPPPPPPATPNPTPSPTTLPPTSPPTPPPTTPPPTLPITPPPTPNPTPSQTCSALIQQLQDECGITV